MAGGKGKIHEHPKAGSKNFKECPENINKKGAPKKSYTQVVELIKEKGYTDPPPSKAEYMEIISYLMVLTEIDLQDMSVDEQQPYWIRQTIKDLLDTNTRTKLMSEYRDWLFGKAEQKTEHNIKGNIGVSDPFAKIRENAGINDKAKDSD